MGQSRSFCRTGSSPKGMVRLHRTSDHFVQQRSFILQKFFKGRLVEQPFYNAGDRFDRNPGGAGSSVSLLFCLV